MSINVTNAGASLIPTVSTYAGVRADGTVKMVVADANVFSTPFDVSGDGYAINSQVRIEGAHDGTWNYYADLLSIDTGTNTLTIRSIEVDAFVVTPAPRITQTIQLAGDFVEVWKAFIESSSVPDEARGYLLTEDFDWGALRVQSPGGPAAQRRRIIWEKTTFKKLFLEDLDLAGLLPSISSTGKISAIRLRIPTEVEFLTRTVNLDDIRANSRIGWARSLGHVINRIELRFTIYNVNMMSQPIEFAVVIPDPTAQQELRDTATYARVIESKTMVDPEQVKELCRVFATATTTYFSYFAYDSPVVSIPCGIAQADILPGAVVSLSDDFMPDMFDGTRGVTNKKVYITGVEIDYTSPDAEVNLEGLVLERLARRSGFAPAAKIASYVDNGGGAGATQHELTLTTGTYDTKQAEGLYFLASMKVELREWNSKTPASESRVVSSTPHNVAGTSIYLSSAPSAGMQTIIAAGNGRICLDEYDTAAQITEALAYLHVCDDADNLIGTTTDRGFQPS